MPDEKKKRTYQSTTLGVPPLRMVLVHARNEAQNAKARALPEPAQPDTSEETPLDREKAIRKIIEHLEDGGQ